VILSSYLNDNDSKNIETKALIRAITASLKDFNVCVDFLRSANGAEQSAED